MVLFLIAAVVLLVVAVGLVYFMGKKAPRMPGGGSKQSNPQNAPQQQSQTPPSQQPSSPAGGPPQNPVQ